MPVLNLFCTHHFFIFKSDVISVFLIFAWIFGLWNTSKMFMALGFEFFFCMALFCMRLFLLVNQ